MLAKDENNQARLATVLYNLLESLRIIAVLISAAMPQTAAKMQEALQLSEEAMTWQSILTFGKYPAENKICPSGACFLV